MFDPGNEYEIKNGISDEEGLTFTNILLDLSLPLSIILSFLIILNYGKDLKELRHKMNASYIAEADTNTKFYNWCLNANNIDTLMYISDGKAYLCEFDEACLDSASETYKVINLNGEYQYIPTAIALSFPTHEEAEEYAKQIVGEENIICTNYPKHNDAKTKKLVP